LPSFLEGLNERLNQKKRGGSKMNYRKRLQKVLANTSCEVAMAFREGLDFYVFLSGRVTIPDTIALKKAVYKMGIQCNAVHISDNF
jgi:hypothetical protein